MRFSDSGLEAGFVASRSQRLNARSANAGAISFVLLCINFFTGPSLNVSQGDEYAELNKWTRIFDITLMLWCMLLALFFAIQGKWKVVSLGAAESFAAFWFIGCLIFGFLTEQRIQASFLKSEHLLGLYDPTWLLLFIDAIITCAHVVVPIRWGKLLPLDVVALGISPVLAAMVSDVTFWWVPNILTITALLLFSIFGGRTAELQERQCFHSVIVERTLRAQVEFQLAQRSAESPSPHRRRFDLRACSTIGDEASIGTVDMTGRLDNLVALGRQEHWLVDPADLSLAPSRLLGQGGFGFVMAGALHGTPVAVKFPLKSEDGLQCMPGFVRELRALRHIRHPNIAAFHGAVIDRSKPSTEVALVLELVVGPSLGEYVCDPVRAKPVDDRESFAIALGICRAARHLHGHRPAIVHGDLKPSNVLLEMGGGRVCAKLLDFGLSRILSSRPTEALGGSLRWMAPELLQHGASSQQSTAADVFSYGRVLHFTLSGDEPFPRQRPRHIRECLSCGDLGLPDPPGTLTSLGREWWRLGVSCLQACAQDRPSMAAVGMCLELFRGAPELSSGDGGGSFRIRRRCHGAEVVAGALVLSTTAPWESAVEEVRSARARFAEEQAGRARPGGSRSLSSRRLAPLPPLEEEPHAEATCEPLDQARQEPEISPTTTMSSLTEPNRHALSL